ncbi:hypothetical protein BJV78DRAFT_1281374 [Lactifluus subvellereus]|nr:hypothetical protein BJV78DRAFT_1281374 [Lactifluus subvellereus]
MALNAKDQRAHMHSNGYKVADITGNVPQDVRRLARDTLASYGFARNGDDAFGVGEALEITKVDSLNPNTRHNDKPEVVVEGELVVRRSMLNGAGTAHGG